MVTIGGSYNQKIPYIISCITSLHVGRGQSQEGFVDLPIQRDNLGFPTIWGSSLKGAIRNAYYYKRINKNNGQDQNGEQEVENIIFGSINESDNLHASSLVILDATLLFIPVRSLYGLFAVCTHPYLLYRCAELLRLCGSSIGEQLEEYANKHRGECIASSEKIVSNNNKVILREEEINCKIDNELLNAFDRLLPANYPFKCDILNRIVLLNDDYCSIITRSTIVQTRIRIDYEKKIVKEGGLWTEEFLPEFSALLTALLIRDGRKEYNNSRLSATAIKNKLKEYLASDGVDLDNFYLTIGGNETLGKGIVRFHRVREG